MQIWNGTKFTIVTSNFVGNKSFQKSPDCVVLLTCVPQNFQEHFIKPRRYYLILLRKFFCKLLECSRTLCELYIRTQQQQYKQQLLLQGVIDCLETYTVRDSNSGRLLISRDGENCEFGLVVAKIQTVAGLNKFIENKYCTQPLRVAPC